MNLLDILHNLREQLIEGIETKSITVIEAVYDEIFAIDENKINCDAKNNFQDVIDNLKSAYKNKDFNYAKNGLRNLNYVIFIVENNDNLKDYRNRIANGKDCGTVYGVFC
ncbi:hypothetical protein [Alkaliphilus sp. B6464]|uniref:hypothetical protein n=1 Tax=Alkaliphilus sp. B6464 TaxID=2731219 RepID=UPI001BA7197C|nr:hypothetical protein [Alkaliphilus sp. B6464]QUH22075.1 hypothetical protein HYG84_19405 [Alkaliphilus sp. B6464]